MKNFGAKWLAVAAVVGVAAGLSLNGCSDGGGGTGTAGTTGTAGRGGTTGSAGRGGTTGTGGGGTTGNAGRGGTTGTGGGGTTGSGGGGTTGSGGSGGAGGGLPCPGLGTFDSATDKQGFGLNTFMDSAAGAAVNLAVREAGAMAVLSIDTADGDPSPGSLKVDAPFDAYKQFVDVQHNYGTAMLKNWTGAKLHVHMKVMGGNPSSMNPMGVQPYVNTGAGYNYCGKYYNLIAGNGWNDYVLDLATCPSTADPSMVIAFGINLATGDGSNGDGGTNSMLPATATVHVDSFWLEYGTGSCTPGTGGTGGGAAGRGGTTGTAGTGGGAAGTGGGAAGRGGTTGTAGTGGGAAGTGGGAAGTGGGAAGTGGGAAGTGGAAALTLYDFETGTAGTAGAIQGWASQTTGATVAASADQHFDGAQSLKITHGGLDNANLFVNVSGTAVWPGTVITFHAYLPAGFDTTGAHYFQAVGQGNNYAMFDTAGNGARTATAGAWNTWTYTVPNTFPGGFQALGFQLGDNSAGPTIAAGSVYVDAITATGGTQNCALATPTGAHTFETSDAGTLDTNVYKKDGSDADTVATQSTEKFNGGTGSWKVAFTALPAPATAGTATSRRVYIAGPNIYCGQVATVHVFLPAGSDGLTFQVFAQYNNYGKNSFTGPATASLTRDAWNTYAFTVPSDVGPGGIQQLGVQLNWAGTTAFTGNVYIDDVTW